jgi:hypothetical protein
MSEMGEGVFMLALTAAAALLAGWLDVRVGESRPRTPGRRVAHAAVAFALLQASVALLRYLEGAGAPSIGIALGVFVLFLPMLVYAFLAALWLVRTLAEVVRSARG